MFQAAIRHDRELVSLIAELSRVGRVFQRSEGFCMGLTFGQFHILDLIDRQERLPLARLHGLLDVEKSTTTRLVAPLVRDGLVVRNRSAQDSRAVELTLTDAGRQTLGQVWDCLGEILDNVARSLPENERDRTLAAVRSFLTALRMVCLGDCC